MNHLYGVWSSIYLNVFVIIVFSGDIYDSISSRYALTLSIWILMQNAATDEEREAICLELQNLKQKRR